VISLSVLSTVLAALPISPDLSFTRTDIHSGAANPSSASTLAVDLLGSLNVLRQVGLVHSLVHVPELLVVVESTLRFTYRLTNVFKVYLTKFPFNIDRKSTHSLRPCRFFALLCSTRCCCNRVNLLGRGTRNRVAANLVTDSQQDLLRRVAKILKCSFDVYDSHPSFSTRCPQQIHHERQQSPTKAPMQTLAPWLRTWRSKTQFR
jgi:hypothetical protein